MRHQLPRRRVPSPAGAVTRATQPDAITTTDIDVYARAIEAPGAMRALCEIYRELDHDAEIHRTDLSAQGKLTVPVPASGGDAQSLAANYPAMCEEIAVNVTGHLVPAAGHWIPEENPTTSRRCPRLRRGSSDGARCPAT